MMLAKRKPQTPAISRCFLATARLSWRWILALLQVKQESCAIAKMTTRCALYK